MPRYKLHMPDGHEPKRDKPNVVDQLIWWFFETALPAIKRFFFFGGGDPPAMRGA